MRIILQRIYDDGQEPGYRVLVDRVWPRGITKEKAALDEWCKDVAPSTALRKWFGHDPAKWDSFRRKYTEELQHRRAAAESLLTRAHHKPLVLLYGAKDTTHTHALVLKEFLEAMS